MRNFSINHQRTLPSSPFLELDDEIAELEAITALSPVQKARLSELKSELESIIKKKEEYVKEHPEQRGLVYAAARRRQKEKEAAERPSDAQPAKKQRSKFDKNGLPRHPERSVYLPPPGMPYAERRKYRSSSFLHGA